MLTFRSFLAVAMRPWLWPTAVVQVCRLAPSGWWKRPPFLPLPDRDYMHFRMVTQYGGDGTAPSHPSDVVDYLSWCRSWSRSQ